MPAKAVWCYFGMDENDMVNHTYAYYTIWAVDGVKNKYYKENTNAKVVDGIYIFKNISYDLVRKMQEHTISKDEYIKQCKNYLKLFVDKAEDFCVDLMEVYNCKLSFSELQRRYKEWMIKVKQEFYAGGNSDPRNPNILKMFGFVNVGERAGSGVDKIMTAWAEQNWKKPEFDFSERSDRVTLKLEVGQVVYIPGAADIRNENTDQAELKSMSKEERILEYIRQNGNISTQKYCKFCKKHTMHKETK